LHRGEGGRRGDWLTALALGAPAVAGGLAMAALFPEGGSDHFAGTAFWPMFLVCLGAVALVDPTRRTAIWAAAIYLTVLVAAFAIPNPLGQNALRPGVVLGPALLVLFTRPRAPRVAVLGIAVALLYLQWLPAVRAVEEARGDPSTHRAFHAEVLRFLQDRAQPGERLEVPLTRNHWEATYLAQSYPLARGWHRQLDLKVNPLFYDHEHPLTAGRYERWLRENAVRWVALPSAPLDFSAQAEKSLLLDGLPFLKPLHTSPDWSIWEVRHPEPPVAGPARCSCASTRLRTGRSPTAPAACRRTRRRAGRSSTCAAPGWSACAPASRLAGRCGASRAARSRPARPCPRVRSTPLCEGADCPLACAWPCGRSPTASPCASCPRAGPTCSARSCCSAAPIGSTGSCAG
jgi:hypothetical protein